MKFTVITLFPEMIRQNLATSVTGRAWQKGFFEIETIQLRDFADNSYGRVDDSLAGGGTGMLIQCEPVQRCLDSLTYAALPAERKLIYLSPKGKVFNQALAKELAGLKEIVLLCGHYEGIDDRVLTANDIAEVSLGDYVLTAGEYGACIIIDAVARMLEGVLPNQDAFSDESHFSGYLEQKQYTKPAVWRGKKIPAVLLGGNHREIDKWQRLSALSETAIKRPDLFDSLKLSAQEYADLAKFMAEITLEL